MWVPLLRTASGEPCGWTPRDPSPLQAFQQALTLRVLSIILGSRCDLARGAALPVKAERFGRELTEAFAAC